MKESNSTQACWSDLVIHGGDPLSTQERDRLNKIISARTGGPNQRVTYSMLDGFLTALLVGPTLVPRDHNQGLEIIWNEAPSASKPNSRSEKIQQQMVIALGRHAGHMLMCIQSRRDKYQPYAYLDLDDWMGTDDLDDDEDDDDEDDFGSGEICTPSVVEWCRGFMKFVALSPDSWVPILKADAARSSMVPFIYFGANGGWDERKELQAGLKPYRLHFTKYMKYFIFGVSDYFRPPLWQENMSVLMKQVSPVWTAPTGIKQLTDMVATVV